MRELIIIHRCFQPVWWLWKPFMVYLLVWFIQILSNPCVIKLTLMIISGLFQFSEIVIQDCSETKPDGFKHHFSQFQLNNDSEWWRMKIWTDLRWPRSTCVSGQDFWFETYFSLKNVRIESLFQWFTSVCIKLMSKVDAC